MLSRFDFLSLKWQWCLKRLSWADYTPQKPLDCPMISIMLVRQSPQKWVNLPGSLLLGTIYSLNQMTRCGAIPITDNFLKLCAGIHVSYSMCESFLKTWSVWKRLQIVCVSNGTVYVGQYYKDCHWKMRWCGLQESASFWFCKS
jgi:hypothetical protein